MKYPGIWCTVKPVLSSPWGILWWPSNTWCPLKTDSRKMPHLLIFLFARCSSWYISHQQCLSNFPWLPRPELASPAASRSVPDHYHPSRHWKVINTSTLPFGISYNQSPSQWRSFSFQDLKRSLPWCFCSMVNFCMVAGATQNPQPGGPGMFHWCGPSLRRTIP